MVANEKDKPASSLDPCIANERCRSREAVPASLEFVITSRDPKFNKGLMKAMSGSDHLIGTHGLKSIFERVYHTDTEAVAVVKHGCEKSAKSRLRRALHSRIPFAKEVGLKMFLRKKRVITNET